MTFDAFEASQQGSQPVEVYEIVLGATTFRYASSEDDITFGGFTYIATAGLRRGKVGENSEGRSENLEILLPADNDFVRRFINNVPGSRATVTIVRVQRPDFPTPETVTLFQGQVRSVEFIEDATEAKILIAPTISAVSRAIPLYTYMKLCNHVLYDARCGINKDDPAFRHVGTVLTVTPGVKPAITVSGAGGFAADWFTGGYVTDDTTSDVRLILKHTGTSLQILLPFPVDMVGRAVTVRAGCDRTIATCKSKFNNVLRFGGFAFVPLRNIFETGLS